MKKLFLPVLCITLALTTCLTSCKQDDPLTKNTTQSSNPSSHSKYKDEGCNHNDDHNGCNSNQTPTSATPEPACGTPTTVNLTAGSQHCVVGTVTVSNGPTQLSVTYTTTSNYRIRGLHLFVGNISQVPTCWSGANTSQFPYSVNQCTAVSTYTINIPLSSLANCVSIAAEADISGASGCNEWSTQQAWGAGTAITNSGTCNSGGSGSGCNNGGLLGGLWHGDDGGSCNNNNNCNRGTYFSYCKQSCTSVCITPPSLLFGGESTWPNGVTTVTVGGFTYNVTTMSNVLSEPSNDAQTALFVVATLKIYGNSIYPPASVTSSAATVEAWLRTVGQLTATSSYTAPANVETAIAAVQAWEASDYCQ